MNVEFTQLSDRGQVREHNEDYIGHAVPQTPSQAKTRGWLFALADGVGGQAQGEVASRTAVEAVLAGFRKASEGEPLAPLLGRLVEEANRLVLDAAREAGPSGAGMATTLVACALRAGRATVAHVGDSRCYLIRKGRAVSLTRDHTMASDQARMGLLSAQEEAQAPTRHLLSRSLGTESPPAAEISEHMVLAGDVLVLCSDGLHGEVSGAEIAAAVRETPDLHAAARQLLALANQRGGNDNISVQMIRVVSVDRVGTYRGLPYRLR
ncbi:MAG TPA: protein phosphatase 2C domain-containing protein [Patescibacteria group bacterium]|nr:protein phosphatase 2C domain-containing protein [Patescibacteria group bacterium]